MVNLSSVLGGALGGSVVAISIRAVDQYSREFSKASTALGKFGSTLKTFAKLSVAALAIFSGDAVRRAKNLEPIKRGFEDLTKNSAEFLKQIQKTTEGTVNSFELMSSANKALLLGIEQNKLPELFRQAIIVGQAAGRTATEAIEDITTGIGRQSRLILDNLGIIVKAEEAYEEYAKKIGKSASELTVLEQKTAFTEAAMESLRKKTAELGGNIENTLGVQFAKLKTIYADVAIEVGESLLPAIKDLTGTLIENKDGIVSFFVGVGKVVTGTIKGISVAMNFLDKQITEGAFRKSQIEALAMNDMLFRQRDITREAWEAAKRTIKSTMETVSEVIRSTDSLKKQFEDSGLSVEEFKNKFPELAANIELANKRLGDSFVNTKIFGEAVKEEVKNVDSLKKSLDETTSSMNNFSDAALTISQRIFGKKSFSIEALRNIQRAFTEGGAINAMTGEFIPSIKKNDFVMRPGQSPVSFNPNDTIIGVKNASSIGGNNITVNIDRLSGLDADEIANALRVRLADLVAA